MAAQGAVDRPLYDLGKRFLVVMEVVEAGDPPLKPGGVNRPRRPTRPKEVSSLTSSR